MNTRSPLLVAAACAAFLSAAGHTHAEPIIKAASGTSLTAGTSWDGDAFPGSGDVATWGSASGGTSLGGALTWASATAPSYQGIAVTDATANIAITSAGGATTLALGAGGIDMAAASKDLAIDNGASGSLGISIGAAQTWKVASGRTLIVGRSGTTITLDNTLAINSSTDTGSFALGGAGATTLTGAGALEINGGTFTNNMQTGSSATGRSGTTTLASGNLVISTSISMFGSGAIHLNGGAIGSGNANSRTITNAVNIGGNIQIGGSAPFSTGAIHFSGGATDLGGATRVITSLNSTVVTNSGTGAIFSGVVSNGGITKEGSGYLTLSNNGNSFTGATTINAGSLAFSQKALANSSSVTLANSGVNLVIAENGAGTHDINNLGGVAGSIIRSDFSLSGTATARTLKITQTTDGTFAGSFTEGTSGRTIALQKTGAATLTLSGTGGYSGGTTLEDGTLRIGANTALGTGTLTMNGGRLGSDTTSARTPSNAVRLGGNVAFGGGTTGTGLITLSGTVDLLGANRAIASALTTGQGMKFSGVISNGGITVAGSANGILTLAGANTYTGATDLQSGYLAIGLNAVSTSTSLALATGTRLYIGMNGTTTVNNLTGAAGSSIRSDFNISGGDGARTVRIQQAVDGEFAGTLTEGGGRPVALTKAGTATLTLGNALSCSGTTSVDEGTLVVNGGLSSPLVSVAADATLAGNGNITGNVTIKTNGLHRLVIGATPAAQTTRTITGILTLEPDNILALAAPVTPLGGATYVLATATGGISGSLGTIQLPPGVTGSVVINGNNIELTTNGGDDYAAWAGPSGYNLAEGPGGDDDHDSVTNLAEYAFGLDPTNPASVAPCTPPDKTSGSFTYTRRNLALTGLGYAYEYSTTLGGWLPFEPMIEESDNASPVETVTITLPSGLLDEPALFIRVEATQP